MKLLLAFLISLLFTGCTSGVVKIMQKDLRDGYWYTGTGVVVGSSTVITPYHVVDGSNKCEVAVYKFPLVYKTFNRYSYAAISKNIEPTVVLMSVTGHKFKPKDIFKVGSGQPYKAITRRGTFEWEEYRTKPGDSGSAVVNSKGELVGIVYGHQGDKPIYLRIKKEFIHEG